MCIEVAKYKRLYDKSKFNYKNRDYNDNCWREIARGCLLKASMIQT